MKALTSLKMIALSIFAALTVAHATAVTSPTPAPSAPTIQVISIEHAEALGDQILQAVLVLTYEAESPALLDSNLDDLSAAVKAQVPGLAAAIDIDALVRVAKENALAIKSDPFAVYEQLAPQVKARANAHARSLT